MGNIQLSKGLDGSIGNSCYDTVNDISEGRRKRESVNGKFSVEVRLTRELKFGEQLSKRLKSLFSVK